jgi:hypothetical protein
VRRRRSAACALPEAVRTAKRLHRANSVTGKRRSLRKISAEAMAFVTSRPASSSDSGHTACSASTADSHAAWCEAPSRRWSRFAMQAARHAGVCSGVGWGAVSGIRPMCRCSVSACGAALQPPLHDAVR